VRGRSKLPPEYIIASGREADDFRICYFGAQVSGVPGRPEQIISKTTYCKSAKFRAAVG
jgi:hypothetical protein